MKKIVATLTVIMLTFSVALAEITYPLSIENGGTGVGSKSEILPSVGGGSLASASFASGVASITIPAGDVSAHVSYTDLQLTEMFDKPADLANGEKIAIACLLTSYPQGRSCSVGITEHGLMIVAGLDAARTTATLVVVRWIMIVL